MTRYFSTIFRGTRYLSRYLKDRVNTLGSLLILKGNSVRYSSIVSNGIPFISVARDGLFVIGQHFHMNNNVRGNPIGRVHKCSFFVDSGAELIIGNNVGMSSTAIVARKSIQIGDHVKIGGGVCIYDTDFHSLDPLNRLDKSLDAQNTANLPVIIHDNVFIGAHSTILKGVTIGKNAIVGASSVVTKNIPADEIWAGNPAKFIKRVP